MHHLLLGIEGEAAGEVLHVDLHALSRHGLQKDLVPLPIGKAHHPILDGGTVPRAHPLDNPGVEGGTIQILPDDLVGLGGAPGKIAGNS